MPHEIAASKPNTNDIRDRSEKMELRRRNTQPKRRPNRPSTRNDPTTQ